MVALYSNNPPKRESYPGWTQYQASSVRYSARVVLLYPYFSLPLPPTIGYISSKELVIMTNVHARRHILELATCKCKLVQPASFGQSLLFPWLGLWAIISMQQETKYWLSQLLSLRAIGSFLDQ